MSIADPAKLGHLSPLVLWDGDKRSYLSFRRAVVSTCLANRFNIVLEFPKEQAILAFAANIEGRPYAAGPDDEKQEPSKESLEKATAVYERVSPAVSSWIEAAIPQTYKDLLISVPIGDAFTTWKIISDKALKKTDREPRHLEERLASCNMRGGVSLQ
jgi:hypothetical protein